MLIVPLVIVIAIIVCFVIALKFGDKVHKKTEDVKDAMLEKHGLDEEKSDSDK